MMMIEILISMMMVLKNGENQLWTLMLWKLMIFKFFVQKMMKISLLGGSKEGEKTKRVEKLM